MRTLPVTINPELVEPGDLIEVDGGTSKGLSYRMRGVAHTTVAHGKLRHIVTEEGGIIATYEIGGKAPIVTLYKRADVAPVSMFEWDGREDATRRL